MQISQFDRMDLTPQSETAVAEPAKNTNTVTMDNVFSASFYGDLEKLRNLVEQDGASLSLPDNNGYYPLQWASLKRFPEIVQYMIEHGGDVNAVDNSQQTALHWAALEGSISVADLLLQNGARLEAADVNGYRAVHIAAQCGRTCFLNHIVAKHNADFDVPDNDGRTPLHWAAYKGFADTVRFLLSRDASQDRRDKQGYTPIQLASDQHHRQVALLLNNALQAQGKHLKTCHANSTIGKNWPMIIAMQGDRYTGKSFLAEKLAFRMKCPLICLDDFLSSSEATSELDALISHTFGQIVQIVGTQISLGFSVVIDSPLSHLSHLRQLVGLISSKNKYKTRLLIMECKPTNKYAFQLIFEERGSAIYANRWYKPAAVWPLPEIRRDFTDVDIPPRVSKLVVNTTDYYSACQMFTAMFDVTSCGSSHIVEYNSCWNVIHADKAKQFTCPTCTSSESSSSRDDGDNLHKLTVHQDVDLGNKLCRVCDDLVSGPCYTCKDCPLTLHKSCAELARGCKKHFEPKSFPRFVSTEPRLAYSFPVERPCVECREDGKDFSSKCEHCLFESHLKSRLVPTVVRHKAHNGHFCTLKIDSNVGGRIYTYICLACRKYGKFAAYFLNVHVMYHPECLLLPPSLSHAHGGYTHDLDMVFGFKNELEEDYLCDCCHEKMDPKAWYFYCSDCEIKLHLECAFIDFD